MTEHRGAFELVQQPKNQLNERVRAKAREIDSQLGDMGYAHADITAEDVFTMPYNDYEDMIVVNMSEVSNPRITVTPDNRYDARKVDPAIGYDYKIKYTGQPLDKELERIKIIDISQSVLESILLDLVAKKLRSNLNLKEIANAVSANSISVYLPKKRIFRPENLLTPNFRRST